MLQLVRLVLDESWSASAAATRLSQTSCDPSVLRRMTLRVQRALEDRPSTIAERAAITLALARGGEPNRYRNDVLGRTGRELLHAAPAPDELA